MPGASRPRVDEAGIATMQLAKGAAQSVLGGDDDGVNKIGHQAITPDLDLRSRRRLCEQVEIQRVFAILEEGRLAPVAALRHVMREAGDDEARWSGHLYMLDEFMG